MKKTALTAPVDRIVIQGAHEHNLRSIDVEIPHNALTVITGVSGSGKSSLAFDIIYRDGSRRYLESFSSFARQFLGKAGRPAVQHISGLSPAISVDQKTAVRNSSSTVGTLSEIYDYLRLFYARLGKSTMPESFKIDRQLFSFNTPKGACPVCKGLGVTDMIDADLIIEDPGKTLREGALVITTKSGYTVYSQVTIDVMDQVCRAHGFTVDIPWCDLTAEQKNIIFYGSDRLKIPFGKHTLESRMKWSGITAKPREEGFYKGIIPVMNEILKRDRNKNILRFARTVECDCCRGARLNQMALSVLFRERNIAAMSALTVAELDRFFSTLIYAERETAVGEPIRELILQRTALLLKLGVGYLTLERKSNTLSGGEAQRIRLAVQAASGLRGILYVLDEPSIGLHPADTARLLEILRMLVVNGNTVVVVEHDEETIRSADWIIDIGPGAGIHGGEVIYAGRAAGFLQKHKTIAGRTWPFLNGLESIAVPALRRKGKGRSLRVVGAAHHNLKTIDVEFKVGAFNAVTGVSGSGKSTLVENILARYLKNKLHGSALPVGRCGRIEGGEHFKRVIEIDQAPIGRTPRSNPATYTKLFDRIRELYASLPDAQRQGLARGAFSFNVKGGRCETCQGGGVLEIGMHFLDNVDVICSACGGKRFKEQILAIRYKGKNIADVLEMGIEEASIFFGDVPEMMAILDSLTALGLGYLKLGQPSTTLSGGEAQRIKLASELCKVTAGDTLYILDEPTTGLSPADIRILLVSLHGLVERGHTLIVIEHNMEVVKTADHIVDLGPGSGSEGGRLMAHGTPETVCAANESITAPYLREMLTGKGAVKRERDRVAPAEPTSKDQRPATDIVFRGVTTHNLKDVDFTIPRHKITAVTGVSGSGKSSLAFDTLFTEGRNRFSESLSSYARRFVKKFGKADFDNCENLSPAIAVNGRAGYDSPRSTVGTATEIYDYYRLLFSRAGKRFCPTCGTLLAGGRCLQCGFQVKEILSASMFSFNNESGACPHCCGLGHILTCDQQQLISHPELSLAEGAMKGCKTGRFYGEPDGQYLAILREAGDVLKLDFEKPWRELSERGKRVAMFGCGDLSFDVTWKFKRGNRSGIQEFSTVWKGFAAYVNGEYERKHADKRGEQLLPLMKKEVCPGCSGAGLQPEILSVTFAGLNIFQLSRLSATAAVAFFDGIVKDPAKYDISASELEITGQPRAEVLKRHRLLSQTGLAYLAADRRTITLSGGEASRMRLVAGLGADLCGITYVLDEPTAGLHPRDTDKIIGAVQRLRDLGNTVVVVEHDEKIIRSADHIIDMGPGAGVLGGTILASGTIAAIEQCENSLTGSYLGGTKKVMLPQKRRTLLPGLLIRKAVKNNLKGIDVEIPAGGIIAVTGVSGSGKSTLLLEVVAASLLRGEASGCSAVSGGEKFSRIIVAGQATAAGASSSCIATCTGMYDVVRTLFAATALAKERGFGKKHFSFNSKGGRCEHCSGRGEVRISMDFLSDVRTVCEVCNGDRFKEEVLACRIGGRSILDVLNMTILEACTLFKDEKKIVPVLQLLVDTGLDYLTLGQSTDTFSAGEAQGLKLTLELLKGKGTHNLYIFDEPAAGLHPFDIDRLLKIFHKLADEGHTVVVIEHHMDVVKNADHVLDLGPEGGGEGGYLLGCGTPEEIAGIEGSPTGMILKEVLQK